MGGPTIFSFIIPGFFAFIVTLINVYWRGDAYVGQRKGLFILNLVIVFITKFLVIEISDKYNPEKTFAYAAVAMFLVAMAASELSHRIWKDRQEKG